MSMVKKSNNGPEKKGVVSDDELGGVTGGGLKIIYRKCDGKFGAA